VKGVSLGSWDKEKKILFQTDLPEISDNSTPPSRSTPPAEWWNPPFGRKIKIFDREEGGIIGYLRYQTALPGIIVPGTGTR
jgi:hypothetical protein